MLFSLVSKAAACVALLCLLSSASLWAFPPAPGIVVYGTVRDAEGGLVDGPDAYVVFKSGDAEIARAALNAGVAADETYRALLPTDMSGAGDGYRDEVLDAALPFTIQVQIGQKFFDPIETKAGLDSPDEPGSALRFDFSLGTDGDGDGLPDEWERRLLRRLGYAEGDDGYSLDAFSSDLDYDEDGLTDRQEYLAGTFAYLSVDSVIVEPQSVDAQGRFRISALIVEGGVYEVVGSADGVLWETLDFWAEGDDSLPEGLIDSLQATDTRIITILVQAEDVDRLALFRLKLH